MAKKDITIIVDPLSEDDLRRSLKLAEDGDTYEGKRVIYPIYFILSPFSKPRNRKKPTPLPDYVNEYLMNFFKKILRGVETNQALNLTRPGRPQRLGHIEKRVAATLVYQMKHNHGLSVEAACAAAEQKIALLRQKVLISKKELDKLKRNESNNSKKLSDIMKKHQLSDRDIWGNSANIPSKIKPQINEIKQLLSANNEAMLEIYKTTKDCSAWQWLINKYVSKSELQQWYFNYKDEIQEKHEEINL